MKTEEKNYVDWYINWLHSNIKLNKIDEYAEITTPFLDRHNDRIQFYVRQDGDKFILTDDGYTISDLEISGLSINSERREEILRTIMNGLGVRVEDGELIIEASRHNFPQKQHLLIQAIISVNDMFMLSQSRVAGVFLEDVELFLQEHNIRFTPNLQLIGKSGFPHHIHFAIPLSHKKPERLIKAINNPTRDKAQNIIFTWNDIKETRKHPPSMFVFVNDIEKPVRPEVVNAFNKYGLTSIPWTERQAYVEELAA